jgi:hypothetical protein
MEQDVSVPNYLHYSLNFILYTFPFHLLPHTRNKPLCLSVKKIVKLMDNYMI